MFAIIRKTVFFMGLLFTSIISAHSNSSHAVEDCSASQIMKLVEKAKTEIDTIMYLTIATVDENASPWNAPVYSAFDKQYNFYWMSSVESQHSKNIRDNKKIFAVIYDSTVLEGIGFGVYLRGEAHELNLKDIDKINHGIAVMEDRVHSTTYPPATDYLEPYPRRVYEFIPHQVFVNVVVSEKGKNIDKRLDITQCILQKPEIA